MALMWFSRVIIANLQYIMVSYILYSLSKSLIYSLARPSEPTLRVKQSMACTTKAFEYFELDMSSKGNNNLNLLDSDSESESGDNRGDNGQKAKGTKLSINKKFAAKYEAEARYKELQRSKELMQMQGGESESEDSETEDEDADRLDSQTDLQIVKTINMIRKKDPKIYDSSTVFFQKDEGSESEEDAMKAKESKKSTYKDVIREQLLEDGADLNAEDDSRETTYASSKSLAYDREQENIRKAFLRSAGDGKSDDDDDSSSDDGMLVVKKKDPEQEMAEKKELMQELEKMQTGNEEGDKFLADFIGNRKWQEGEDSDNEDGDADEDEDGDKNEDDKESEDVDREEEELDAVDRFESSYNFRFEEEAARAEDGIRQPGAFHSHQVGEVRGHSRQVESSVRRSDDKRKKAREERKERKEREKRQKVEELKRLKNLKRDELRERLKKVAEAGGVNSAALGEEELDEDWDETKHEQMMQRQFGDEYYDEEDMDFSERLQELDEDEVDRFINEVDYGENDDEESGGDDEEDREGKTAKASRRGKKGRVGKDAVMSKKELRRVAEGMMNELYELDYEDVVAGMPTRFKYKTVEPESYGLESDEILLADDKELNKVVGLSKLATYHTAAVDSEKLSKKRKRFRTAMRERLAREAEEAAKEGMTVKGHKGSGETVEEEDAEEQGAEGGLGKKKRKRRKGKTTEDGRDADAAEAREKSAEKTEKAAKKEKAEMNKEGEEEKKRKKKKRGKEGEEGIRKTSKAKKKVDRLSLYA